MVSMVTVTIEPSFRLSEILGFPYSIDKEFSLQELVDQGVVTDEDIKELESGKTITKSIPLYVKR